MCLTQVLDEGLQVGASVTLTRLMDMLDVLVKQRPKHETRTYKAMYEQLRYFAGPPIRNTASVGGNIATGSPISDLNPLYMAAGATFVVVGKGTPERRVSLAHTSIIQPSLLQSYCTTSTALACFRLCVSACLCGSRKR